MPEQAYAAAKERVKVLVAKYESEVSSGGLKKYSEEDIKKGFIEPLFKALGWNIEERHEVSTEESIRSSGRVDYGFYLNGWCKFYLEAKSAKTNIYDEQWARQAIRYSWNKGVTWAVLTNFEKLLVFNAQDIKSSLHNKKLFDISFTEYISRFDDVWLLSKESFLGNALDAYAEKIGKKYQKIPISDTLYKDLNECREKLTRSLAACNPDVKPVDLDEGVQKLLDRLIFLRVAEDRNIERNILRQLLRESEHAKSGTFLYEAMAKRFRELDKIYNSNLFQPHSFESWEEFGNATKETIKILYGKEGYYDYDFKVMSADVLGTVYENYLGYRLSKQRSKKKLFKEVELSRDAGKRKEQGIYYTPTYVVDYIVRHALQPVLDKCDTIEKLMRVKVVDPSCGSGSFLIKALEVLNEKYKSFGEPGDESTKLVALVNNIYGVDLDRQAVEIARLNLLINSLDKKMKLPFLTDNIKCGNSLISGTDDGLKKCFGKNFQDKKPFNWKEEFPTVFKQGGFDVIIGNPPYVRNRELDARDKKFFGERFESSTGQYDLYQLFFERSIELLKDGGLLGFITSNKYTIADYGKGLREYILKNCKIRSIVDVSSLRVFKDASTYPYIIILEKTKKNAGNIIVGYKPKDESNLSAQETSIDQDAIAKTGTKNFTIKEDVPLLSKIEKQSEKLGDITTIKETIHTGNIRSKLVVDSEVDKKCKKLLAGKNCHRYWFKWGGKWIRYDSDLIDKSKKEYANLVAPKYFEEPKILLREIAFNIECCYDDKGFYTLNKVYSVQPTSQYDLKYILALLNSKLLSFYFRNKFEEAHVQNNYLQFKKIYTSQIPIRKIKFSDGKKKSQYGAVIKLSDKTLNLYKDLWESEENSDQWASIKSEIEKTDKKIDAEVYKLYGLTSEEIKIVEKQEK